MISLFKSKPILSNEDREFQIATYEWLLKNFGGENFYEKTALVLPTRDFFPDKVESAEEAVHFTFERVKKYAGLEEWPCKLETQEEDAEALVAPTLIVKNAPTNPHGTFQAKEDGVVITYNPALVENPPHMIATFAHELAHYLTGGCLQEPPGGWDNWEFATDIASTYLGFGLFMANTAFNFTQYSSTESQGWSSNRSGYLSEPEHIYALAIFLALKDIEIKHALPHLKGHLRKLLKRAEKELLSIGVVEKLKQVEYVPSNS